MNLPYRGLGDLIRGAGKRPVERDSFYRPVRDQFDQDFGVGAGAGAPTVHAA